MTDAVVVFLLKKAAKEGVPVILKLDDKEYVVKVERSDRRG